MINLLLFISSINIVFAGNNPIPEPKSWLDDWLLPHPGLFIWTVITFFIVLLILKWKAWGPLMNALEDRENRINEALSFADKAKQEAEKVSGEYDEMIKKAQTEAQEIIAKSKKAGDKLKEDIENKAKEKANEIMDKTEKEIESAKVRAIDDIKLASVDLAIQAASKVINKNLDDSTNKDIAKTTINEAN